MLVAKIDALTRLVLLSHSKEAALRTRVIPRPKRGEAFASPLEVSIVTIPGGIILVGKKYAYGIVKNIDYITNIDTQIKWQQYQPSI